MNELEDDEQWRQRFRRKMGITEIEARLDALVLQLARLIDLIERLAESTQQLQADEEDRPDE